MTIDGMSASCVCVTYDRMYVRTCMQYHMFYKGNAIKANNSTIMHGGKLATVKSHHCIADGTGMAGCIV